MNILIAEDDAVSRRVLERMLTNWGYAVESASDGEIAWERIRANGPFSMIVLDWMMPGMSGVELCRRVRDEPLSIQPHIILVTSKSQDEDIIAGLDAGANDYVTKPFRQAELRARVRAGLRIIELQMSLAQRVAELEEALAHVKTLQGILPICMYCHKIRTDDESWQRIEQYISAHSEATFSHSLCPECLAEHYPEVANQGDTNEMDPQD